MFSYFSKLEIVDFGRRGERERERVVEISYYDNVLPRQEALINKCLCYKHFINIYLLSKVLLVYYCKLYDQVDKLIYFSYLLILSL